MTTAVVMCGHLFDGRDDRLLGPTEILIEDETIVELSRSVGRAARIRELVRMEACVLRRLDQTMNTGGYMSAGDDPARVTWFEDEMQSLGQTAQQLGMPLAVHSGAADGSKQALRAGTRGLEHCYPSSRRW